MTQALIDKLFEYAQAGGGILAPVFLILFLVERNERKDAQSEVKQIGRDSVAALAEVKALVAMIAAMLPPSGRV